MKQLVIISMVFLACFQNVFADDAALKKAQTSWLRGDYEIAEESFTKLAKDTKTEVPATIGLSKALVTLGNYDKALKVIEDLLKKKPKDPDLLARKAEMLYLRGKWDEALSLAKDAIKIKEEQFQARWVLAQVYRDQGEIKKADVAFRWFVKTYVARDNEDKPIKDPEELLLVGLAGTENARWYNLADQFEFILQEVYTDALKQNRFYWPAEVEAGLLLLEKYNRGEALDALNNALSINPVAAKALVGKGIAALQKLEYEEADKFADRAIRENPSLTMARRLKADVLLGRGDFTKALEELEKARKVNPREESTLGRIAVCYLLTNRKEEFDALVAEVKKHDKVPGDFYLALGLGMDQRRRYSEAEVYLKEAIRLRSFLSKGISELGLLYARMGNEEEAERLLKKAYEADPFNVRVANMRKVLRHLEKYDTIKTEHFELRYDPMLDEALARYLEIYLEELYDDLAKQFQHKPTGPILIEVFNNHQMFSGRVVALPDLHTIGACTGKMVAMVSTHGKGIRKPFNWGRVMRHELVHVFNLDQTNFLVPHWFTEGLAVMNEGFPRPPSWNQLLRQRVPKNELFNLDTIDMGFMRPRSADDWTMAYCQSLLYVQFMKKKYGDQTVGEMLNAFRDGLSTKAAVQKVCKVDPAEFERGYLEHLKDVVKQIKGISVPASKPLSELKRDLEKDPNNPELMAQLAEKYLRRNRAQARKYAEDALKRDGEHPLACYVLAQLEKLGGDVQRALTLLKKGLNEENPHPKLMRMLGQLYYDAEKYDEAAKIYELGRKAEPYESYWLLGLAKVYALTNKKDKQIEVLKALVPTDADDLDHRKRLARLLNEQEQFAEAETYARQAIEINVLDAEARKELFRSLDGQNKKVEADRLRKILK